MTNWKKYKLNDICFDAKCIGPVGLLSDKEDLFHWKLQPYKTKKKKPNGKVAL